VSIVSAIGFAFLTCFLNHFIAIFQSKERLFGIDLLFARKHFPYFFLKFQTKKNRNNVAEM
jgi:hypothetical protein